MTAIIDKLATALDDVLRVAPGTAAEVNAVNRAHGTLTEYRAIPPGPFALPLRILQRATDRPDMPGHELPAIIGDAHGRAVAMLELRGTAKVDNDHAMYIVDAVNAYRPQAVPIADQCQAFADALSRAAPNDIGDAALIEHGAAVLTGIARALRR